MSELVAQNNLKIYYKNTQYKIESMQLLKFNLGHLLKYKVSQVKPTLCSREHVIRWTPLSSPSKYYLKQLKTTITIPCHDKLVLYFSYEKISSYGQTEGLLKICMLHISK